MFAGELTLPKLRDLPYPTRIVRLVEDCISLASKPIACPSPVGESPTLVCKMCKGAFVGPFVNIVSSDRIFTFQSTSSF